jgi:membrane protease YdiL (CAAX protease family)
MTRHAWRIAAITITVLVVIHYVHRILSQFTVYRGLYRHHPFYVPESIDKIAGVVLCVLAVWIMRDAGLRGVSRELGLLAPVLPAIAFALAVSSPMLIGFAITRSLAPHIDLLPFLFLTVFSPIVEEIEFRGFGVRQLQRGTGWPFWVVVWPSALLFGLGHVEQGSTVQEMAGLFLLISFGGVVFAWLVYRWQNLWVAIALHSCMNLWWDLFSIARTAIGGWFAFALQNLTILLAIIVTLYWTRTRTTTMQRTLTAETRRRGENQNPD